MVHIAQDHAWDQEYPGTNDRANDEKNQVTQAEGANELGHGWELQFSKVLVGTHQRDFKPKSATEADRGIEIGHCKPESL